MRSTSRAVAVRSRTVANALGTRRASVEVVIEGGRIRVVDENLGAAIVPFSSKEREPAEVESEG